MNQYGEADRDRMLGDKCEPYEGPLGVGVGSAPEHHTELKGIHATQGLMTPPISSKCAVLRVARVAW